MNERQCCILYWVLVSLAIAVVVALTVAGAKLGIDERKLRTDGPIPAYAGDTGPVITAGAATAAGTVTEPTESDAAGQCKCCCRHAG